jgi:hypothetical protein
MHCNRGSSCAAEYVSGQNSEMMNVLFSVNGSLLFSSLLVIVLANIFNYGSILKEENDLTV